MYLQLSGIPLFDTSVSFLPTVPRAPTASSFDFSDCYIGTVAWASLPSDTQLAITAFLLSASQSDDVPFQVIAAQLQCSIASPAVLVVGFRLKRGGSIATLRAVLASLAVRLISV